MSDLLKEALIDAKILKEAALKNAEQMIVEKYAPQIKEAVYSILEQEDEEEELPADVPEEMGEVDDDPLADEGIEELDDSAEITFQVGEKKETETDVTDDIPFAVVSDDEEEIEINFDELAQQMEEDPEGVAEEREEVVDEIIPDEMVPEDDEERLTEEVENVLQELLMVDLEPVPTGQAVQNSALEQDNEDKSLARAQSDDMKDEADEDLVDREKYFKQEKRFQTLQRDLQELEETLRATKKEKETLIKEHKELKNKHENLKELARTVNNKLLELNMVNARLHYANRVLKDGSLNERQKERFVESLSKVETAQEAKVLFEAFQGTMSKQSLSETINKHNRSFMLLKSAKAREATEKQETAPLAQRFQKLAGIGKKK